MLLATFDFQIVHLAANQTHGVKGNIFLDGAEGILGGVSGTGEVNEWSKTQLDGQLTKDSQSFPTGASDP